VKHVRRILLAIVAALLLTVAWWSSIGHQTPAGQPPLGMIAPATLNELRDEVNRSADDAVRVVLLLSPT
jgi:hypothetical protein